jgi:hypothetical protein
MQGYEAGVLMRGGDGGVSDGRMILQNGAVLVNYFFG